MDQLWLIQKQNQNTMTKFNPQVNLVLLKKMVHKVKSGFVQGLICFLSIHRFSSWPCPDLKTTEVNSGSEVKHCKE